MNIKRVLSVVFPMVLGNVFRVKPLAEISDEYRNGLVVFIYIFKPSWVSLDAYLITTPKRHARARENKLFRKLAMLNEDKVVDIGHNVTGIMSSFPASLKGLLR